MPSVRVADGFMHMKPDSEGIMYYGPWFDDWKLIGHVSMLCTAQYLTRFVPVDEVADDLENECHRVRSPSQHDRVR